MAIASAGRPQKPPTTPAAGTALCECLVVWLDDNPRSGPLNMAIDEALLEVSPVPVLRVYRWDGPWVSIGYFTRREDAVRAFPDRPIVRRWTGGGIVDHAYDWTYSLAIPSGQPLAALGTEASYQVIHAALADALTACGCPAALTPAPAAGSNGLCFQSPVRADVVSDGRKVAGAAQRRTRRGLLHQGSVQGIEYPSGLAWALAARLHTSPTLDTPPQADFLVARARKLAESRYADPAWSARK